MSSIPAIVHLANDHANLDIAIERFERVGEARHLYLVHLPPAQQAATKIRSPLVRVYHDRGEALGLAAAFAPRVDGVVLHRYDMQKQRLLLALKRRHPSALSLWISWGGDFYSDIDYPLFQPHTAGLVGHGAAPWRRWVRRLKGRLRRSRVHGTRAIDYCATVLPTEFDLVKRLPGFRARQVHFNYESLLTLAPGATAHSPARGHNVLLGNSANLANNHLDMFDIVARHADARALAGRFIVPLSYHEETPAHTRAIAEAGSARFGDRFHPLTALLPRAEYLTVLRSCPVAIFNHHRQQAIGTLVALLSLGARIYLCDTSPTYRWCVQSGLVVYSLQREFGSLGLSSLEPASAAHNRARIRELSGDAVLQDRAADLMKLFRSRPHDTDTAVATFDPATRG